MPAQKNENNFTWKHLLAIISIISFVVTIIVGGFALLNEKADKKEVTRIEDRIETQIADVKKDLKEDIGEVKKRVDDIFKIVSDK